MKVASRVSLAVLRRLRRSLIYTALDHLTGRRVRVASAESAHDDVIAALAEPFPGAAATTRDPRELTGPVEKYGILDLTYRLAATSLPLQRPGLGILQEVGVSEGDPADPAFGHEFLGDLASECEGPQLYLKIFLRSEKEPASRWSIHGYQLPPDFWPATFILDDACLTNSRSIWLMKHFYL